MQPFPMSSPRAIMLALALLAAPLLALSPLLTPPAIAQDDDDGDDDDAGFGGSGDDETVWPSPFTLPRAQRSTAPRTLPEAADDQIVVEALGAENRDALLTQGFTLLAANGERLLLGLPAAMDIGAALALVATIDPAAIAAPNSYYRSQAVPQSCSGALCQPWQAVGWPPVSADPLCRFEPYIGVIDTGLNIAHDMLSEAAVTLESPGTTGAAPSEFKHGTAVVALFVGNAGGRVPGLAPSAEILVVDPFGRVGNDERSDVFSLANALDRLGNAGVSIASLSLAGPPNDILRHAIERLQAQSIPVVAAVGNTGPRSAPLYPAAYPGVVGVTAVDSRERIYRRAVQGEHVSFAAPGVAIATAASIRGTRPQTGTSFAVPFVTTALAAAMADGTAPQAAIAKLAADSRDLGADGRDPVFGWGLVQIPNPC